MKKKVKIIISVTVLLALIIAAKLILFSSKFYYVGTIEATKVDISARVGSIINTIDALEGGAVKKGQVLMTLGCEDIKISANQILRDYERAQKLFNQGSIPLENYEHAKNKADDVKLRIEWCSIVSPINGTVLTQYREAGELVQPGTKLFTVADLDHLWTYVYVAEPMLSKIKLNDNVKGYLSELGMKAFKGTITKISDEAEFTPKNVQTKNERTRLVFGVKVSFDREGEILKPGMSIEVEFLE